jgi:hypothetical protein
MTEADVIHRPHTLTVRSAKRQVLRHPTEQAAIDRRAIQIQHADKTTHGCL